VFVTYPSSGYPLAPILDVVAFENSVEMLSVPEEFGVAALVGKPVETALHFCGERRRRMLQLGGGCNLRVGRLAGYGVP
jgi:hypothetical protein